MERTLEGWRQAGEIVSRWVWIHLKVGEPEGADVSSMSELAREKPRMAPETHGLVQLHLLSLALRKGEGHCGHLLVVAVAGLGKAEKKGRGWPSIPGLPAALLWEEVGRCSRGSMGVILTLGGGVGSGSILEDKLGVISKI